MAENSKTTEELEREALESLMGGSPAPVTEDSNNEASGGEKQKTTKDIEKEVKQKIVKQQSESDKQEKKEKDLPPVPTQEQEKSVSGKSFEEMTTAEHEKAALERIKALEKEENKEEEKENTTGVDVSATKKRDKNKLLYAIGLLAVALSVIGWIGFKVWMSNREETAPPPASTEKTDGVSDKRTNLGGKVNPLAGDGEQKPPQTKPLNQSEGAVNDAGSSTGGTDAAPPVFQRYLSLEASGEISATSDARPETRKDNTRGDDRENSVRASRKGNTDVKAEPVSLSEITRIPYNPDLYIAENTPIPCAMDYRFVSDLAGKLRCTITQDIYSASGNTKLIDKGTTAYALYGAVTLKHGQGRAFIMVTKLRTRQKPYLDIPMMDTQAAGELGEAGVSGWIDNHLFDRFSGALMVGMIPDIAAWASNSAGKKDRNTDYTENSRQAMAEMAKTTLENSINIPPTLYKNQGEIITLITGQDIDFSKVYQLKLKK